MNPFTREEEACFKTALALVVVKNRLLHNNKRKQQHSDERSSSSSSSSSDNDNANADPKSRQRTMESLTFPWTRTTTTAADPQSRHDTPMTMTTPMPSAMNLQQSQKAHIQTIMTTALRTALRLVPGDTNSTTMATMSASAAAPSNSSSHRDDNQDAPHTVSLWTTLGALTTHLAHQLSMSWSMAEKDMVLIAAANKKNDSTSSAAAARHNWVGTWVRENLQQLTLPLAPPTTTTATTDPSTSTVVDETSLIQATFLVWHGILLGGYSTDDASAKQSAATTSSHQASCGGLFVAAFCTVLEKEGILVSGKDDHKSPPRSAVSNDHRSLLTTNSNPGRSSSSVYPKAPNGTTTATTTARSSRPAPPRAKHAWQRVFSVVNTRKIPRSGRTSSTQQQQRQKKAHAMSDLWMVHGLQLLQKVTALHDCSSSSGGGGHRSMIHHRLHPASFLPPLDLTQWYVDTVDRGNERRTTMATAAAPTTATLDPGAKLMCMVALCQTLKDEPAAQMQI